ncbi:TetR/AcrR family transcriptional regulator [Flavobacterium kingsejongi]|nr:TetR/AcrR family transcriptional regulator [Flavobacterium kingsejongi]
MMPEKIPVRDRIINTASHLFYTQGYTATGINQIVKEAAIAIGSLYNHFESKTALLLAYLEYENKIWLEKLAGYPINGKDPKKKILQLVDFRMELQESSEFGGCHFNKINAEINSGETEILNVIRLHKDLQRNYIMEIIAGIPDKSQTEKIALADMLFLLIEGAVTAASIYKSTWPFVQVKKTIQSLL